MDDGEMMMVGCVCLYRYIYEIEKKGRRKKNWRKVIVK